MPPSKVKSSVARSSSRSTRLPSKLALKDGESWADATNADLGSSSPRRASRSSATSGCTRVTKTCDGKDIAAVCITVPEQEVCRIREEVFDGDAPHAQPGQRLSRKQLSLMVSALRRAYGAKKELPFTLDVLGTAKLILGRWLRPSEMRATFGDVTIWRRRIRLDAAPGDVPLDPSSTGSDQRVSYAIGPKGATLQHLTRRAGCVYIWLHRYRGSFVATVYALDQAGLGRAAAALRNLFEQYVPRGSSASRDGGDGLPAKGLVVKPTQQPGFAAAKVELKKMYADLDKKKN